MAVKNFFSKIFQALINKNGVFNYLFFLIFLVFSLIIAYLVVFFSFSSNSGNYFQLLGFFSGYLLFLILLVFIETGAKRTLMIAKKSVVGAKKTYLLLLLGRYLLLIAILVVFIIFRQYFRLIGLAAGIAVCLLMAIVNTVIKYCLFIEKNKEDSSDEPEEKIDYDQEYLKLLKESQEEEKNDILKPVSKDKKIIF